MMKSSSQFPANTSHTVLVHAGSYKDFLAKITSQYPQLQLRFFKKVSIHYYIIQLEDTGKDDVPKQKIYELPIMALREEFSNYIFFKNTKTYNNVLKRMCDANHNPNATYDLLQHMMTPFEKSKILDIDRVSKLEIEEEDEKHQKTITTYYTKHMEFMNLLAKLFPASVVKTDGVEKNFAELIKPQHWKIGIC